MPWGRYYYRRRPRRYWRRRFRRPFQRRYWRRRRRVRKRLYSRKLKKITLKQWQPSSVKRLKIKGTYPLFLSTSDRLSNNLNLYLESIAPQYVPGGGGFNICNFSLQTLYSEHLKLHNWWTHTNDNYPLIRFTGCTIKLFQQEHVDYIFTYNNNYPMSASNLTYTSTHPSVMLLNNRKRVIRCKKYNPKRKPYTKIKIHPPSQLQNKWYFQKDIANLPLLQTISTAASLDRAYTSSNAQSTTVGFTSLNPQLFSNHSFIKLPTTGYQPRPTQRLFATRNNSKDPKVVSIGELIFLGDTNEHKEGITITRATQGMTHTQNFSEKLEKYLQDTAYWGNPFHPTWFSEDYEFWITNADTAQLKNTYTSADTKLNQNPSLFVNNTQPLKFKCRYNPFNDDNKNEVYLVKINNTTQEFEYHEPPGKPELITKDLPLWTCLWGYLDYQKKLALYNSIDTTCLLVILSHSIDPKTQQIFIPLDEDFLKNKSPFRPEENHIIPTDMDNWHPKVAFQVQSVNHIACSGPYTAKLQSQQSVEAHMQYIFYFKLGGTPPPMSTLTAPTNQPKYPSPDNILQTTSLQSPTMPIEYYLYSFDQRRHELTKKAIQRIKKYKETETPLLQITDPAAAMHRQSSQETSQTSESEDSEKETETPHKQLLRYRREQKLLRRGINKLLLKLATLE
nr:MAG: ORF1 [TTV-like mini virus]